MGNPLDNIPLNQKQQIWFQHDGAPVNISIVIREHLHGTFDQKWVESGGPISCPEISLHLNPLDLFLWGYLKTLVYATPVNDFEDLQKPVEQECDQIRANARVYGRVRRYLRQICHGCCEMEGGQLEHLI